jgi:hypothetical protein
MSAATILCVVTGVLFVVTGGVKVIGLRQSLDIRDHFGMSPSLWRTVGVLETSGAVGTLVGIWVTPLGVAATIGLACLMVGAVASRLRVHDPVLLVLGDVAALALVVVTGSFLLTR